MADVLEYLDNHPGLFAALGSIVGIVGVIGGWIYHACRQLSGPSKKDIDAVIKEPPPLGGINAEIEEQKPWRDNYPAALNCANWYRDLLSKYYGQVLVKFGKTMITLYVGGFVRVVVFARKNDRVVVCVVRKNEDALAGAVDYLTSERILFTVDEKTNNLRFDVTLKLLKEKHAVHEWLAQRLAPPYLKTNPNVIDSSEDIEEEEPLDRPPEKLSCVLAEVTNLLKDDGRWEVDVRSSGIRFMPKAWLEWLPLLGRDGDARWWVFVSLYSRDGRLSSSVDMAPLKDLAKREAIVTELLLKINSVGFKLPKSHRKEVRNNYSRITASERMIWGEGVDLETKQVRAAAKKTFDDLYPKLEELGSVLKPLTKAEVPAK